MGVFLFFVGINDILKEKKGNDGEAPRDVQNVNVRQI